MVLPILKIEDSNHKTQKAVSIFKRRERASRNGATIIFQFFFFTVPSLSNLFHCLCHVSPLFLKHPKQVFFLTYINIFDTFTHTVLLLYIINIKSFSFQRQFLSIFFETALNETLEAETKLEVDALEVSLDKEAALLLQQFKDGTITKEIALDVDTMEHHITTLSIQAGQSADEIQTQLKARHEKMRQRTEARNKLRHSKMAEKLDEENRHIEAQLLHARETSEKVDIKIDDMVLSSTANVDEIAAMLKKRKEAVLQRTKQRNEKRKMKLKQNIDKENSMITKSIVEGKFSADLELSVDIDDALPVSEIAEEVAVLGATKEMNARVNAINLRADMTQDEIKTQLNKRKEIMKARTKVRAETRKQKRLAAKKKEQEASMAPDVKRHSINLASMRAMVNKANNALKTNENMVERLEAESKQHLLEIKTAQENSKKEKHLRLQARLDAKKRARAKK